MQQARQRKSANPYGIVNVHWGKERLRLALPPPDAPLSVLKQDISQITGVPPDQMKLITSGFVLKNDNAQMKDCNLVVDPSASEEDDNYNNNSSNNSFSSLFRGFGWNPSPANNNNSNASRRREKTITMLTQKAPPTASDRPNNSNNVKSQQQQQVPSKKANKIEDEPTMVKTIEGVARDSLDNALPKIDQLERNLMPKTQPPQHVILSEVLLQNLLKLDSFDIKPEWTNARQSRKDAIKRIQAALDRIDAYKETLAAKASA